MEQQQAETEALGGQSRSTAGLGAWLPIETAPKDGTKVMVACPWLGVCGPANWNKNEYAKKPRPYWTHWGERTWGTLLIRGDQPTHWQPMPEAPNVELTGAAPHERKTKP
jgi:hypothetical protein